VAFVVSGDVEDHLTFIANRQLGRTTRSHLIEGCAALLEISKGAFGNVGDVDDFREGMSKALLLPLGVHSRVFMM
jgi:hypothetical protein